MFFTKSDFKRNFGIEFEMEQNLSKDDLAKIVKAFDSDHPCFVQPSSGGSQGWAESKGNDFWHVKYDSTCGPQKTPGWEIATYVGNNIGDLDLFSKMAVHFKLSNVKTNDWCGLHTHVETKDFSVEKMGKLLAIWLKIEPMMFYMFPEHRRVNKYCRSMRKLAPILNLEENADPTYLYNKIKPQRTYSHENEDKKVSLNIVGYERIYKDLDDTRATIEFRVPECILNYRHVKNSSLFIINFANQDHDYPKNLDAVSDVDEFLDLNGLGARNSILDDHLLNLKMWILKRFIRFGTKKIQENAKTKLNYITKLI